MEQESAYFLLFGRQLSRGGNTSEVWVEVRLPEGGAYPCLRDAYQSGLIANHVESKVAEALGQGLQPSAHAIALAGLSSLTHLVDKSVNCCNSQQNARAVTSCTDCWFGGSSAEAEYAGLLDGYGYLEYTGVSVTVDTLETPYTGALKSDYEITLSGPGIHLSLTEETNAFLGGLSNLGRVNVHYYDESNCVQLDQFLQSDLSRLDETSLAYEENIIIFAFGGETRIFYKFAVGAAYGPGLETLKGGLPSSRQAAVIPAIAGWIMKKALMAGTGVMMHVGITVAFEKWFGDYETWGEAWDNSSFTAWELFYAAVSGALAEHVVLDFFGSIIDGMMSYVLNTPSSSFSWEGFFSGTVTGMKNGVLGLLTGGFLGDLSDKGKAIFKKYAPNINLTPGGPGGGDPWYRVLKELVQMSPTFVAKPGTFRAWKDWFDFPNLRKRADLLENYHPKRKKVLLDVEETFPGCHSIERHGHHLTMEDMRLRAIGQHPTIPRGKRATRFDSEALHEDAVNQAFNTHKDAIEAHFANGGVYKEWDIDYGSQVGSGYYNSGSYNNPSLQQVTTSKVKIAFDADPSNPTGYKMISAYPWYQ